MTCEVCGSEVTKYDPDLCWVCKRLRNSAALREAEKLGDDE